MLGIDYFSSAGILCFATVVSATFETLNYHSNQKKGVHNES